MAGTSGAPLERSRVGGRSDLAAHGFPFSHGKAAGVCAMFPLSFGGNRMTFNSRLSKRTVLATLLFSFLCFAQKDPGVRGGPPGAGGPIQGLTLNELALFTDGRARPVHLESAFNTCNHITLAPDTAHD